VVGPPPSSNTWRKLGKIDTDELLQSFNMGRRHDSCRPAEKNVRLVEADLKKHREKFSPQSVASSAASPAKARVAYSGSLNLA